MNTIYLTDELLELLHVILARQMEYLTEVQDPAENQEEIAKVEALFVATSK